MSSLTSIERIKLEKIFDMSSGYVLDFSNDSFHQHVLRETNTDIYVDRYEYYGGSKAKRLRRFWDIEEDKTVGKLNKSILEYWKTLKLIGEEKISEKEQELYDECLLISDRMLGIHNQENKETSREKFLSKDFDEIPLDKLNLDGPLTKILTERITEIKKCMEGNSPLSTIFMCGSVLEGILLAIASMNVREFNQANSSPKDKDGKVKRLHEWGLINFIEVAFELKYLGLDVKKHSHALRDFRNYIHPFEQMSSGFDPDMQTARISWQVLKAAMEDLSKIR